MLGALRVTETDLTAGSNRRLSPAFHVGDFGQTDYFSPHLPDDRIAEYLKYLERVGIVGIRLLR